SNYSLDSGDLVLAVKPVDAQNFLLITAPLIFGSNYTLTVNSVRDLAFAPNIIPTNSQAAFAAVEYLSTDIGGSTPPGSFSAVGNSVDVTGGGSDIGGTLDQFQFVYQSQSGDFDVQVRVQGFSFSDPWAKAGIMARASLSVNSPFAAVFATPG